jgi:hypothetical protein
MRLVDYAKMVFERECGPEVQFVAVSERSRGADFIFRVMTTGKRVTIGTLPRGRSRAAFEEVAMQAGKWAKVLSERAVIGTVH